MTVSRAAPAKGLLPRFAHARGGATAVGFSIGALFFAALVIGVAQGGLLLFDEIELANAAVAGARTFAIARRASCPRCGAHPYTETINAIANAGGLRPKATQVTLQVGGTACSTDATCLAALNAAYASGAYYSRSSQTTVTVAYPCPHLLPPSLLALTGVCTGHGAMSGYLSVVTSQQVQ